MSIWQYHETSDDPDFAELASKSAGCLFCGTQLVEISSKTSGTAVVSVLESLRGCPTCGWWLLVSDVVDQIIFPGQKHCRAAAAVLRQFDTTGVSEPLHEVRSYLLAKYDARFQIHPRVFEETVASVFRAVGFQTVVTAYSGDNGIDIILTGADDREIGVQVKRHRNAISAEAIRALTGALVVNNLTRGVFVTTSRFQKGALRTSRSAALRGVPIELVDAARLFDALRIAQHSAPISSKEIPSAPKLITFRIERLKSTAEWLAENRSTS
jgi:restriction system protein